MCDTLDLYAIVSSSPRQRRRPDVVLFFPASIPSTIFPVSLSLALFSRELLLEPNSLTEITLVVSLNFNRELRTDRFIGTPVRATRSFDDIPLTNRESPRGLILKYIATDIYIYICTVHRVPVTLRMRVIFTANAPKDASGRLDSRDAFRHFNQIPSGCVPFGFLSRINGAFIRRVSFSQRPLATDAFVPRTDQVCRAMPFVLRSYERS